MTERQPPTRQQPIHRQESRPQERRGAGDRAPRDRDRQVAIALSHDIGSDHAPTVVAKGYGAVAEQILRLAFDNDVKVRTDPDLAQILEVVEVDCEIPLQAFAAVAEILTYIYRMNGSLAGARAPAGEPG